MCIVWSCSTICVGESIVKLALTHKYVYHLEPLQRDIVLFQSDCYCAWASRDPCKPKIPVSPRSQSTQDPSQPKIPVNPRSQSAQDPSQPKIPVSPRSQSVHDPSQPRIPVRKGFTTLCLIRAKAQKGKGGNLNDTHKTFHILKMKAHFKKDHILKMKAHSETHFENENMFLEKWKVINLFFLNCN